MLFQSTRPMRGATNEQWGCKWISHYFNPRAPCGARLKRRSIIRTKLTFQSTRPMRGATMRSKSSGSPLAIFQSTRPMRGATIMDWFGDTFFIISIHAPHAGRDRAACMAGISTYIFQSTRPMRGATRRLAKSSGKISAFQSTRPMRGATAISAALDELEAISIHAPHAGRDSRRSCRLHKQSDFNPRAPCGARQKSLNTFDAE